MNVSELMESHLAQDTARSHAKVDHNQESCSARDPTLPVFSGGVSFIEP